MYNPAYYIAPMQKFITTRRTMIFVLLCRIGGSEASAPHKTQTKFELPEASNRADRMASF